MQNEFNRCCKCLILIQSSKEHVFDDCWQLIGQDDKNVTVNVSMRILWNLKSKIKRFTLHLSPKSIESRVWRASAVVVYCSRRIQRIILRSFQRAEASERMCWLRVSPQQRRSWPDFQLNRRKQRRAALFKEPQRLCKTRPDDASSPAIHLAWWWIQFAWANL